jgi:hypothetical protein
MDSFSLQNPLRLANARRLLFLIEDSFCYNRKRFMEEDLLFALDEPFVPTPPISAFPRDEHGDVFPTKKTRTFDYEKQAASIYRPHNILFKLKRLAYRAIGLAVGEPVVFFRYHLKIENRSVFHRHRAELKDGFITVANHVFPLDCLAVSAVRPFRVPEFPIWQDGFESSNGGMYQAYGGFPVVKNAEGWEKAYRCMKEVLLEKKWLHVYPEAACWYYYVPIREFLYGACLYFGEGVSADMSKAFTYFEKCHSHGSGDLQMKMARIYLNTGTVYVDRAVKCVEAAAEDFDPVAMRMVRSAKRKAFFLCVKGFFGIR